MPGRDAISSACDTTFQYGSTISAASRYLPDMIEITNWHAQLIFQIHDLVPSGCYAFFTNEICLLSWLWIEKTTYSSADTQYWINLETILNECF